MPEGCFSIEDRLEKSTKLSRSGSMEEAAGKSSSRTEAAKPMHAAIAKKKKKKPIPGSYKPIDSTGGGRAPKPDGFRDVNKKVAAKQAGVQRGEAAKRARNPASALGDDFQAPKTKRTTLDAQVVGRSGPKVNRRKRGPERWGGWNESAQNDLEAVADAGEHDDEDDEEDASFAGERARVRDTNPGSYASPAKPAQGGGGRWSAQTSDDRIDRSRLQSPALSAKKAQRVARDDVPTRKRVTRGQAGGDPGAMWGAPEGASGTRRRSSRRGSGDGGDYKPSRAREPVEESPNSKRAKEKQAELKKQGNSSEQAMTLSSSDEDEPEEPEDEAANGSISFLLDDEKIFFGIEGKLAAKKIHFTTAGLRLPAVGIWGDEADADVVPYEEMEGVKYSVDPKHTFLSVTLLQDSAKLQALTKLMPAMKPNMYTDIHHRRILVPLRTSQSELLKEKRQQILDRFIQVSLVDDEANFLVEAKPFQATDIVNGTPYKVRRHTRQSSGSGAILYKNGDFSIENEDSSIENDDSSTEK